MESSAKLDEINNIFMGDPINNINCYLYFSVIHCSSLIAKFIPLS